MGWSLASGRNSGKIHYLTINRVLCQSLTTQKLSRQVKDKIELLLSFSFFYLFLPHLGDEVSFIVW